MKTGNNYNTNQMTLEISLQFRPEPDHPASLINDFIDSLNIAKNYIFGRPQVYSSPALLKLILFAYSRGVYSCRKIETFARENKYAEWLVQADCPSYRTIARFITSREIDDIFQNFSANLISILRQHNLIDEAVYIDGTKIHANANKYSFVWRKNTIRYSELNAKKAEKLISEINEAVNLGIENYDDWELILARLENRIDELNRKIEENPKLSPNPDKQKRRKLKSKHRKLKQCIDKKLEYQKQLETYGSRNSYSKTDTDATFMRLKEDPMKNGQTKPAYNLQIATNNQFVLGYYIAQNPTDTRTLIPFLNILNNQKMLSQNIIADAGYGSETNYRFIEDHFPNCNAFIPYSTMLKEESHKWKVDDRKVMNWEYSEKDDYFVNCNGVRFNFLRYSVRHDSYGFERKFKVYAAEKYDENHQVIPDSLTPKGHVKKIYINPEWEYFKNKAKDKLSSSEGKALYYQRKFDVEPVFGTLKASLRFTRFTVRGLPKVNRQMALVIMAWNMKKLTNKIGQFCKYQFNLKEKNNEIQFFKLNFAIFIIEAVY